MNKPAGIPRSSGCYLFRNARGDVIYVGKARVLAQRLANYFQRPEALSVKTRALMDEAVSVEWIVTPSEVDALVLENELIKANQPRYNMMLKDDKSFPFVALNLRTPFPAPSITRAARVKGVRYFGPYVNVRALRCTTEELLAAYPLRTCTTHKFQYHQRIGRPCLLYDIHKCSGPCAGKITPEAYAELVESFTRFFEGDVARLTRSLSARMAEASRAQNYEAAARLRDALGAVERAASDQSVVLDDHSNLDVLGVAVDGARAALVRFRVRHGRVIGRNVSMATRSMDETTPEILERALPELFADSRSIPGTLVCAESPTSLSLEYLSAMRSAPVAAVVPQRGRRRKVLALAESDALAVLERDAVRRVSDHNVRSRALHELGAALGIPAPYRIECFDMSHLQGTNYVGSMVVFEDGLAKKADYRHFNVKQILGNDDVGAMREVLRRRLEHLEDGPRSTFARPDLIIIDGGPAQLGAGLAAAEELGRAGQVELVALAKREELLFRPHQAAPIALARDSEALYLVQRIRDEAHRFAISFHRSKRARSMLQSSLEGVVGLGPVRRERLLEHFGTLAGLAQASREELAGLSWLPEDVARRLYDHFRAPHAPRPAKEARHE